MIHNGMFEKKDTIEWEDKIKTSKTWAKAKEYFQKLWSVNKDARA